MVKNFKLFLNSDLRNKTDAIDILSDYSKNAEKNP